MSLYINQQKTFFEWNTYTYMQSWKTHITNIFHCFNRQNYCVIAITNVNFSIYPPVGIYLIGGYNVQTNTKTLQTQFQFTYMYNTWAKAKLKSKLHFFFLFRFTLNSTSITAYCVEWIFHCFTYCMRIFSLFGFCQVI